MRTNKAARARARQSGVARRGVRPLSPCGSRHWFPRMDGMDATAAARAPGTAPPDPDGEARPGLLDTALATGTLAAIATGGALVGFGWREGEPGRLFRLAGRALLERGGIPSAAVPLTAVALGYLHHLLVATAWGALLALGVLPWRPAARVAAALLAAAAFGWLRELVPVPARVGLAVTETPGAAVTMAASFAVALLGGAWLAAGERRGGAPPAG